MDRQLFNFHVKSVKNYEGRMSPLPLDMKEVQDDAPKLRMHDD
jgi:hypothetical protein